MSKPNQIDKAIAHLEQEKAVLQMAIDKLKAAQSKAPARKARSKPKPPAAEEVWQTEKDWQAGK